MTGSLWVVCDASGSMAESGKNLIMRGLVRAIEQYFRLGYAARAQLRLFWWGDYAVPLDWHPNTEVPEALFANQGSANGESLGQLLTGASNARVLVLTDGYWTETSRNAMKDVRAALCPDALRYIKVGADANPRLQGPDVFVAEDLFEALDRWLEVP